jgi:hypothetical protein
LGFRHLHPLFQVSFILPAVSKPILSVDFLSAHHLLVDPLTRQVLDLDASTLQPVVGVMKEPDLTALFKLPV